MVNYSQASQDLFVIKMLENKRDGFYVEVGGSDPIRINNTYLLEKDFGWTGFSLEKDATLAATYNSVRKNVCHSHDALSFDFRSEISKMLNGGSQVDYLSLDIEPGTQTLKCLTSMPHEEYRFSVITFEHEMYSEGPAVRDNCRKFLNDLGYQLVVGDVKNFGHSYEDWFVDPKIIKESVWGPFVKSEVEHSQLGL